jgi:3,4-dihydroxy 2-butanone 4-phosphate synthase/GTP cyclohydrolase II
VPDQRVEVAADTLHRGELVILLDEEGGTADLIMAAGRVTGAGIAFLATHARGLTELALSAARVAALRLPPMSSGWEAPRKPFTVSIEARVGVGTGISARDRAETIRVAVDHGSGPEDLIAPGHVFPLRGRPGGLTEGQGRVEAALALAELAGCGEGAVLCPILDEAGDLADGATLEVLAARFAMPRLTIAAIATSILGEGQVFSRPLVAHGVAPRPPGPRGGHHREVRSWR